LSAWLIASFLSLFSFSSTETLTPKPQIDATNQQLQQTSRLLLSCLLPSCKEYSNPKPNPKKGSSNYSKGWAAQLASFVLGKFCVYSQSGDDPQEDLAKFYYKLNMKVIFKKHPSIFLAKYLNHVYKSGDFS
jgi:hypothetical protein